MRPDVARGEHAWERRAHVDIGLDVAGRVELEDLAQERRIRLEPDIDEDATHLLQASRSCRKVAQADGRDDVLANDLLD
jgi:hypothetical protein